jgi:hypothetical protein
VLPGGEPAETVYYHLKVPKLKGRAAKIVDWKKRPITEDLGAQLEKMKAGDGELLLPWLAGTRDPAREARKDIKAWVAEAEIISPRTGELLKVNPRRFRYTVSTRMAIEGASRVEIAEALGHSDLQNVEVYIEAAGKIIDQLGQDAFDFYDSVVPRFRGKIVENDDPQPFEDVPRRRLPSSAPHLPADPLPAGSIGACGHDYKRHGPCEFAPPLACYTCPKFAAFKDAPHGEIGEKLKRMIATQDGTGADRRVPHQLEETVTAIHQLEAQIASEDTKNKEDRTNG